MKYRFTLADAYKFGWDGLDGSSYSEKSDFDRASAAQFVVSTRHGRVLNDVSDRIYLVLDGDGWFDIEGNRFTVEASDVVIVPRQTEYDYGTDGQPMTLFLVHSPAYDVKTDHDLESKQS